MTQDSNFKLNPTLKNPSAVETTAPAVKQIKLSAHSAAAIQTTGRQVQSLEAAAEAARRTYEAAAFAHQQHLAAIVQDAGYKLEEFSGYGIWKEENGDVYLRPQPRQ